METYNFDKLTDRHGTGAYKTDNLKAVFGRKDLIPLWVADMEFETPPFIMNALRKRLEHPILGYTMQPENYWEVVVDWIEQHHQWSVKEEWLTFIPGIVKGIGFAVNVFVKPDEKVIIQPPVYHPFRIVPEENKREVVYNPLKENADGSYSMDFDNLEAVCDEKCRMLILSNPHNPAGIVWDRNTQIRLANLAHTHNLLVVSDEIHCDMALFDNRHTPFASVSEEASAYSITFAAPSKTFNIAGVVSSYAIVPNDELRAQFYGWLEANELASPTLFSTIATLAAFTQGESWRKQMLHYVEDNVEFIEAFCKKHLPQIKPLRPQASFLVWLDCRGLNLSHKRLIDFFVNQARLALNDGAMFGMEGTGFMRLNVGTPRSVLQEAMERVRENIVLLD